MSEPTAQATVASARAYGLAEGPLWDGVRDRVIWVDINAGDVHAATLRDGRLHDVVTLAHVEETVGAAVCDPGGRLLIARARTVVVLDDPSRAVILFGDQESRLNDGACDPAGRFLVGSMALDDRRGEECLYRLEHDGSVTIIDDDLTLSNGLGWSPDGATFYSVDTIPGVVYRRDYDAETGTCGPRRALLHIEDGAPDGLCVDADGNLWIAMHGAGEVRCHAPDGAHLDTVAVPTRYPTSVAFAGADLSTLVITSTGPDERTPVGHLYTARVGVRGLAPTPWRS